MQYVLHILVFDLAIKQNKSITFHVKLEEGLGPGEGLMTRSNVWAPAWAYERGGGKAYKREG